MSENIHDLVNYAIKQASKLGTAIVSGKNTDKYQIRIANSEIEVFKQWKTVELDIFLAIDKRTGSTSILQPSKSSIDKKLTNLKTFVTKLEPSRSFLGIEDQIKAPSNVDQLYDKTIRDLPVKAPELLNAAVIKASEAGARRTAGSLIFNDTNTFATNSYGFSGEYQDSHYELTLRSFLDDPKSSGQGLSCGRSLQDIERHFLQAGQESGEIAALAQAGKQGKAGTYDLVLHPTVAASIFSTVMTQANPFYIMLGMSPFKDRIGEKLAVESLNVWDDGTYQNGLGSQPFDFEGTPTKRTQLFENGVLKQLIHNTSTAKQKEADSTGNSKLYKFWTGAKLLLPRPTNFVFQAGDHSLAELFDYSRPTIYVTSNWYLRFTSSQEGIFSTIPRDGMFLIEDGEIGQPIRKLRITDNLLRMLKNVEALGKNETRRQVHWWEVEVPTFIPPVRVKDVPMTAATQ